MNEYIGPIATHVLHFSFSIRSRVSLLTRLTSQYLAAQYQSCNTESHKNFNFCSKNKFPFKLFISIHIICESIINNCVNFFYANETCYKMRRIFEKLTKIVILFFCLFWNKFSCSRIVIWSSAIKIFIRKITKHNDIRLKIFVNLVKKNWIKKIFQRIYRSYRYS